MLIFMLLLVAAASYALITKLNASRKPYVRDLVTNQALSEAKQALISYAVVYPEEHENNFGPGYLPCPDINKNGSAGASCSFAGSTTIGRFPWRTVKSNDFKDSNGQRLWYVVSDNFKNNPKLEPLNSETQGQLRIDLDADGVIDVDDIVAIVIAPHGPVNNQNRDTTENDISLEIANYLEGENAEIVATFDNDFVVSDQNNINDRLVYITRSELMEQVEKRILGDVKQILSNYFSTYNAYPWLSSFADPKAVARELSGTADTCDFPCDNTSTLNSNDNDFIERGVKAGDIVYNITDSSIGTVNVDPVASDSLTVTSLLNGDENDFDEDDEYIIFIKDMQTVLSGTATAGSANLILKDNTRDMKDIGVSIGDVLENISDNSNGIITAIGTDDVEVRSLTGGTNNVFNAGDIYQIRSNYGVATASTSGLQLEDTNRNFISMGLQVGDLIWNITDDSIGRVSGFTATTLTVDSLLFGTNNNFSNNDKYFISRFNASNSVRKGLLGIHSVGEPFKTALGFDWAFTANAADFTVTNSTILLNYINNYVTLGYKSFDDSIGTCVWFVSDMADCFGYFKNFVSISGNLTSGSNTVVITDSEATFNTDNVKRGDIAQNYDDETLQFTGTVDAGNSGTATADTDANGLTIEDTNNNFINVDISVGSTIFNTTDNSSGTISAVSANQITVTSLTGGTDNIFEAGDNYTVDGNPALYDASADFSIYERYSYVIQNNTQEVDFGEGKIQGVISDISGTTLLEAESYVGEGTEPIIFRPGDAYQIYQPRQFVVETVSSETQLTTDNYIDGTNPDFDDGEYYRIMPAANSMTAAVETVSSMGATDTFTDSDVDFLALGVEVGDIVETAIFSAFGEITAVTSTSITTRLYGGSFSVNDFIAGLNYTIYYDYVYSREHILHTKFRGNENIKASLETRVRDVCLGYDANCSSISGVATTNSNNLLLEDTDLDLIASGVVIGAYIKNLTDGSIGTATAVTVDTITVDSLIGGEDNIFEENDVYEVTFPNPVAFTGNGGVPLVTVNDYQEDETTQIGNATFTPSAASTGSLRVGNIDFTNLSDVNNDMPSWFINNDWHKLVYVAISSGDAPNTGVDCAAGANCLTVDLVKSGVTIPNNDVRALVMIAGAETNKILDSTCSALASTVQDRTNGTINEYFESENCDQSDDLFQKQSKTNEYNDQILIMATSP
jgi:hypothetical protein